VDTLKESGNVYNRNMPGYATMLNNFQDFMVTMNSKDWQQSIDVKAQHNYYG